MQEAPQEENAYVLDAESSAEMARLIDQDLMVTKYMGGLLSENPDFSGIKRVMDIACGPGGWAQEVAFTHPDIEVVGVDVSRTMIQYAQAQARVQGLDNLRFLIMDALKPLDFPDNSFDLVNIRFAIGFMSPQVWPNFIQECFRIARSGGMIRVTETDDMGTTTSEAFEKLWIKTSTAFMLARRSFSPAGRNFAITPMLSRFLRDAGCKNIRHSAHAIDFSTGAEAHDSTFHDWMVGLKLLQPFQVKMGTATQEEVDALYQQALGEMMSDNFCAVWSFLTASGVKP